MTTNEDAPAVAENAEPVEASLALALDAVWSNLASASACLDRWHEADKPTAALPVTGPGAAFAGFLRMAAEQSVLNGPKDAAVAEVREVMLPIADTYFGLVVERVEIVEGLAPQLLAMLRHHAAVSAANDMAKKCPVFGIAADWTELHKGVMARQRADPDGKVQLADMEVLAAEELLEMAALWAKEGRPMPPTEDDGDCGAWLVDHLDWLPLAGNDQMDPALALELLLTDPADVALRAAAERAAGANQSSAASAMAGVAADWRCLHLDLIARADRARTDGSPLVLDELERRLAREFVEAAVLWDEGGRPEVHPADAAAGAWMAERRHWIPTSRVAPLAQDHALELLVTNPLDLAAPAAPAAPVDPAAV